jgi:hypothetical protein
LLVEGGGLGGGLVEESVVGVGVDVEAGGGDDGLFATCDGGHRWRGDGRGWGEGEEAAQLAFSSDSPHQPGSLPFQAPIAKPLQQPLTLLSPLFAQCRPLHTILSAPSLTTICGQVAHLSWPCFQDFKLLLSVLLPTLPTPCIFSRRVTFSNPLRRKPSRARPIPSLLVQISAYQISQIQQPFRYIFVHALPTRPCAHASPFTEILFLFFRM